MHLEREDIGRLGWVDSMKLFEIINRHCAPIALADFRLLLNNLNVDDQNRVDWRQFVVEYNPNRYAVVKDENVSKQPSSSSRIDPPQLQLSSVLKSGSNNMKNSISTPNLDSSRRQAPRSNQISAPTARPRTSARQGGQESSILAELRRKWTIVLRECQKQDSERTGCVSRADFKGKINTICILPYVILPDELLCLTVI